MTQPSGPNGKNGTQVTADNADLITWAKSELGYTVDEWDNPVELVDELTAALEAECARLAGIIEEARNFDGMQTVNGVTDEGWMSPDEWVLGKIDGILAQATK